MIWGRQLSARDLRDAHFIAEEAREGILRECQDYIKVTSVPQAHIWAIALAVLFVVSGITIVATLWFPEPLRIVAICGSWTNGLLIVLMRWGLCQAAGESPKPVHEFLVVDKKNLTITIPDRGAAFTADQILGFLEVRGWRSNADRRGQVAWSGELNLFVRGANGEEERVSVLCDDSWSLISGLTRRLSRVFQKEHKVIKLSWRTRRRLKRLHLHQEGEFS